MQRIRVIDSHTAGEPTRVIADDSIDLGSGTLAERRNRMQSEHDFIRRACINEPRGNDFLVGAILQPPCDSTCEYGVIFFNNAGYINMCGHGTIGLVATLKHLELIQAGTIRIDTPVGPVTAQLHADDSVTLTNVVSYLYRENVRLELQNGRAVSGDIAWGGNWFFLVSDHGEHLHLSRTEDLTALCRSIRKELEDRGITGANGEVIDHIELLGPPSGDHADGRNFVYCPGGAYDRSPCGTGTSAKIACMAARGSLTAGERWRQESIVGSVFEAHWTTADEMHVPPDAVGPAIVPVIRGKAFVTAEAVLLLNDDDPFRFGIC